MKKLLILLIIPLLSFSQCLVGDCDNGSGFYLYEDGVSLYQGEWKNGVEDGWGISILYDDDGNLLSVYDGEWKDGAEDGWGTETLYNEDGENLGTYTGEWKEGDENGWGVLVWGKGDIEEGIFKNGDFIDSYEPKSGDYEYEPRKDDDYRPQSN